LLPIVYRKTLKIQNFTKIIYQIQKVASKKNQVLKVENKKKGAKHISPLKGVLVLIAW